MIEIVILWCNLAGDCDGTAGQHEDCFEGIQELKKQMPEGYTPKAIECIRVESKEKADS